MKKSILKQTFISFVAFGSFVGAVFPPFASLFVTFKPGLLGYFWVSCVIAGISIGLFAFLIMKILLLSKLQNIASVARKISNKELTHHCEIESDDMIGDIIDSFNTMAENLRLLMKQIGSTVHNATESSTELQKIGYSLSERVAAQHQQIESLRHSVEQSTQHSEQITATVAQVVDESVSVEQSSSQGVSVLTQTAGDIQTLSTDVNQTAGLMTELETGVENIAQVLGVIRSISEQTNLLALNAAIEAARAGEMGRGFAVVADEVRSLATRTQGSTQEITEVIDSLKNQVGRAATMMQTSDGKAVEVVEQVQSTLNELRQVSSALSSVAESNKNIADSAEHQLASIRNTLNSADALDELSRGIASDSKKRQSQTDRLTGMITDLRSLVDQYEV